ncbi:hypothetical protein I0G06_01930 [Klebsiella quasivariicola]|uniref:hypothetical protein n=1 Tax=Klebsiella quasivariicola TaxID=2026240 RepID=UPI0018A2B906|nr:hypothetical protein [Klebsiella quasivariicola]MBF7818286.1 hypothetical protein [Klebsiella quasivariicola]
MMYEPRVFRNTLPADNANHTPGSGNLALSIFVGEGFLYAISYSQSGGGHVIPDELSVT